MTVQGVLELAVREHQSGRLDDAMALYQHVIAAEPHNADALHLSGMIQLARGRTTDAIALMERALVAASNPPPHFRSNLANAFRESGQLERAEAEYRAAIAAGGGTPEVFNNLGLTLIAMGRPAWAIEPFESSLARRPRHAPTLTNLSVACLAAGAFAEALRCADEALAIEPELQPARLARASALAALDRADDAEPIFRALLETPLAPAAIRGLSDQLHARGAANDAIRASQAVTERWPNEASGWLQHAANLARAARVPDAEHAAARACELSPQNAPAQALRGALLLTLARIPEAIASLTHATSLDPLNAEAWTNLSVARLRHSDFPGAVHAADLAARCADRSPATLAALGAAQLAARQFTQAETTYRELLTKSPTADAWNGLGVALERRGMLDEAIRSYSSAIACDSTHAVARVNLAKTHLLQGDFAAGWKLCESRHDIFPEASVPNKQLAPRWSPGARRTDGTLPRVLLFAEQGLGDAIQFVRFAAAVRREAARVIVQAPEPVRTLLASAAGVDEVVGPRDPIPPHDFCIHAMSLPLAFGTSIESVPADVPYLRPNAERFEIWRERLGRASGLRIALCWSGSPGHYHDASRSIPLQLLQSLAAVSGVQWFSVQKGPGLEQLGRVKSWPIGDLGPTLNDMSDTAAALALMDLVITVDTSVAHLAGAIGARTWTLLAHPPEWRWLLHRRDTPWYPTMTLFRQRDVDQWPPVVARVRHRLERLVRSKLD